MQTKIKVNLKKKIFFYIKPPTGVFLLDAKNVEGPFYKKIYRLW